MTALHLLADCGLPMFPSTGNVTVSGTTEGAMATFQCEEGLIPSGLITSTCTDTGQTGGQWQPDPATIQCRDVTGIYFLLFLCEVCNLHAVDLSTTIVTSTTSVTTSNTSTIPGSAGSNGRYYSLFVQGQVFL